MQGSKLYVGNLRYSVTSQQLQDLFAEHGEVKSVNIIEGKGFGFVEMGSTAEADKAREALNGSDFDGRTLKIDEAKPPRSRDDRGRDGGGGGPRRY
jgi:RNA recognition motif-containing protein